MRIRTLGLIALMAVVVAGCSASDPRQAVADETMRQVADAQKRDPIDAATEDVALATEGRTSALGAPVRPSAESVKDVSGPKPMEFPYETELDISAEVVDPCVRPGDEVVIRAEGPPEAATVYQAVYSDGKAGSPPPFGAGYGGNDKGYTSKEGEYLSTWTLSPTAPVGPARVDVIMGFDGKWGYAAPHFAVADADGSCPSAWMKESDDES